MLGEEEIRNRFGYHKGTTEGPGATAPKHKDLRQMFMDVATILDKALPHGRAFSVAMTKLQEASMWANFAIAECAPVVDESEVDFGIKPGVFKGPPGTKPTASEAEEAKDNTDPAVDQTDSFRG
jgi:hypothetical protein